MNRVWRFVLAMSLAWIVLPAFAGSFVDGAKQGVAINGYDPVAYFTDGRPQKGSSSFTAEWGGTTWRFASEAHRALFKAAPEHYAPQYGGYCAYAMTSGNLVPVDARQWHLAGGKLYLNKNWFAKELWLRDVQGHVVEGDAHWRDAKSRAEASK